MDYVTMFRRVPPSTPSSPPTRNKLYAWYVDEINYRLSTKAWTDALMKESLSDNYYHRFAYSSIKIKGEQL